MHTAAENLKEILASTLNSICWWIGHQTYWGVFAWTCDMSLVESTTHILCLAREVFLIKHVSIPKVAFNSTSVSHLNV